MKKAAKIVLAIVVGTAAAVCVADTKTTYRDAQGRYAGSATTNGKQTTYRDAQGRVVGTQR